MLDELVDSVQRLSAQTLLPPSESSPGSPCRQELPALVLSDPRLVQVEAHSPPGTHQASNNVFEFTVASAPLHGVMGAAVNASLMRAVNGGGRVFLIGVRGAGVISATTAVQRADRWDGCNRTWPLGVHEHVKPFVLHQHSRINTALMHLKLFIIPHDPRSVVSLLTGSAPFPWDEVYAASMAPLLRKAFEHVRNNCKCDVTLMHDAASGLV